MTKLTVILSLLIALLFGFFKTICAGDYGIFILCENGTKHCIDCAQTGFSHGEYIQVPNSADYTDALLAGINDFRSDYAHTHNISDMRFTAWNTEFFDFIWSMTSDVGNAKFFCVTGNKLIRHPTQFNHEIVDFHTSFRIKMSTNSTSPKIFRSQYNILLKKALRSDVLTEYNVDEFACEYSFKPFKRHTNFLLRCIFYINPEFSEGAIKSTNYDSRASCTTTARYPGLCEKI